MDKNSQRYMIVRTFIFIGLIGYMAYNLFVEKSAVLRQQIQQEITASKSIIPGDKWHAVIANTESSFSYLVNEYGLIRQINNILLPDPTKQVRGINIVAEQATSYLYTASQNIPLLIFQSIYRWYLVIGWAWVFLPYLLALFIDGMYQWKLKRYVFGKVTVQFYRIWFKAFWFISMLTSCYLVLPNMSLFNNVAQLFPPLALLILGIAINRLCSNYQKLM